MLAPCWLLALPSASAADTPRGTGVTLYVATNGSDHAPGSEGEPLATLAGARDRIRELKMEGSGLAVGGVTVYFREGRYAIAKTVNFTPKDAGTPEEPILYAAYPGETAVFTGGAYIPGAGLSPVTDIAQREHLASATRDKVLQIPLYDYGLSFGGLDYGKPFWMDGNLKECVREECYDIAEIERGLTWFMILPG